MIWIAFFVLGLLPAAFAWKLLSDLVALFLTNQTYTHIPMVPAVAAYFIHAERRAIFSRRGPGWKTAGALAVTGIVCVALARINPWQWEQANQISLLVLGWVFVWTGAFGMLFGEDAMRAAAFPLGFLLFAVPIPAPLLSSIMGFLQRASADGVNLAFRAAGTPFVRHGYDFALPGVTIEVAQECSGIRSTLALVMVSVLAGHLWLRSFPRTLLLCVAAVPIAIAKNVLRIAVLSWLAIYVDPGFLFGRLHRYGGIPFFAVGLLLMGFVLLLLRRARFRQPTISGTV